MEAGTLYVIATPLGNLEDITRRAVRVLGEVDLVVAEDTRRARKLLSALGLRKPTTSYHKFNEAKRTPELVRKLQQGLDLALVSDAGTPAVSDPGALLVSACHAAGLRVVPVPGPNAVAALLSVSGFDASTFSFFSFLPKGPAARRRALQAIAESPTPVVFFTTCGQVEQVLAELATLCEVERELCLGRELTKLHEEILRGTIIEVARSTTGRKWKGEITIVVGPRPQAAPPAQAEGKEFSERARELVARSGASSTKELADELAAESALPRKVAYKLVVEARKAVEKAQEPPQSDDS